MANTVCFREIHSSALIYTYYRKLWNSNNTADYYCKNYINPTHDEPEQVTCKNAETSA